MSERAVVPWSVRFRREREASWKELEQLVLRCERGGPTDLRPADLARLPVLYQAAVSSLGVARASLLDRNLLAYLEALVARAYLVVYAPKRAARDVLRDYLVHGFARAVRQVRWHVLASAGTLAIGGAIGFATVSADPESYYLFVDAGMASGRDPSASTDDLRRTLFEQASEGGLGTFTVLLFTHNSSVGILTYGLGFALGLPVLLLLLHTGLMVGAMTALFHLRGLAVEWWSWILPHGVTELTAFVLCGAAGLAVAQRVVFPGRASRLDAFADVGRRMGAVVAGSVVMLLLAAFVEGVFRQVVQSLPVRYGLAAVFAGLWLLYFVRAGRERA